MSVISYFNQPIKKLVCDGLPVEYCSWGDGFRLVSVNGLPSYLLNNTSFSHYFNMVLNSEKGSL